MQKGKNVKKKEFVLTAELSRFVRQQPDDVQAQFNKLVKQLETNGFLVLPYGKKLSGYENLFEIRIVSGNSVRVFYCYLEHDLILGVSGFEKKSLKTPKQEIKKALKIIRKWEV